MMARIISCVPCKGDGAALDLLEQAVVRGSLQGSGPTSTMWMQCSG